MKGIIRRALIATLSVVTLSTIAGCAGAASPSTSATPGQLPQKYIDAGQITASTICDGEPFSYCEPGSTTAIGLFADIAHAWGAALGVKVDPIGMAFDSIIPATASGRYDVVLAIGDTVERQEKFDFIDILYSSSAIIAPAGNPKGLSAPEDLCGLKVASTTGSQESKEIQMLSEECLADGKKAIENVEFIDLGSCYLAVSTDRVDAAWGSDAAAFTIEAKSPDLYKVAFTIQSDTIFAIAVPKDNPELRDAIAVAVAKTMEDGTYEAALQKWHLESQGVEGLMINGKPAQVPGS